MRTVEDWKKELLSHGIVEKVLAVNTTEDVEGNFKRFLALLQVKPMQTTKYVFAVAETEEKDYSIIKDLLDGCPTRQIAYAYFWERTNADFEL